MKIAFFDELGIGGARKAVNEFAIRLRSDHEVDLFYVDEHYRKEEEKYFDNVYYFEFKSKIWKSGNWKAKIYKDTVELFKLYNLHKSISKRINGTNYDVVVVSPSKYTQAPFILRLVKSKKIYYCQESLRLAYEPRLKISKNVGLIKYYYEQANRFVRKRIDLLNIKAADFVLTNSKNTKNEIMKNYKLPSIVSYLGVDVDFFKPGKEKNIDVLFVGSDDLMDGFDLIKDALSLVKHKIRFETTAGFERKNLSDLKLRDLYARAKIVVCSAYNEPFGMTPLESMASGALVIAVSEGGYRESIVNNKNGLLVERDKVQLANKIDWVMDNSKNADIMRKNARQAVVREWSWEKRTKEFEKILLKFSDDN